MLLIWVLSLMFGSKIVLRPKQSYSPTLDRDNLRNAATTTKLKKNKIISSGSNIGRVITNMHKLNEITCEQNSYLEAPCHRLVNKNPSLNGTRIFFTVLHKNPKFFPKLIHPTPMRSILTLSLYPPIPSVRT